MLIIPLKPRVKHGNPSNCLIPNFHLLNIAGSRECIKRRAAYQQLESVSNKPHYLMNYTWRHTYVWSCRRHHHSDQQLAVLMLYGRRHDQQQYYYYRCFMALAIAYIAISVNMHTILYKCGYLHTRSWHMAMQDTDAHTKGNLPWATTAVRMIKMSSTNRFLFDIFYILSLHGRGIKQQIHKN